MAIGFNRKPLGMALQSSIMPGDQPDYGMGDFPKVPHGYGQNGQAQPKGGFFKEGGMGRLLAGAIGDALLQNAGMRPVYAPAMQQRRESEREEVKWQRQRAAEREDKQWEWQNKPKDVPTIVQNAQAWATMSEPQRAAYREMQIAQGGDPTVNMSLGDNRFYSGPKSGLATALGGASGNLDATPTSEDGMSYIPGPGGRANPANWKAAGGPVLQAPATFR